MNLEFTTEFERPWLLLCEGLADKMFFHQLITYHEICLGKFSIHFPGRPGDQTGGRAKFGRWLETAYDTSESFRENVESVLIVGDNDDDMNASFNEVQAGLRAASFPVPVSERRVAEKGGYPNVVALMLPSAEPGNLETLCVRAAYNKWPLESALDAYVDATPAHGWQLGKKSKTRLHAILAATCETKPDTSFAYLWQEREEFHIPLDDDCFSDLVEFLKNFETMIRI